MKSKLFMSVLSLLFVICICLITSSDSIAGKFKVGDNVITNKYYHHLYGETKKGTVVAVFDLKDANYQVIGLSTREDISEYWLEKDVYNKIGYPPIPLCYGTAIVVPTELQKQLEGTGWYVGQKVWDIQRGRGIIKEIKKQELNSHGNIIPQQLFVRFDDGELHTYCCDKLIVNRSTLHPIETTTVIYYLDILYSKPKCDCSCYQCENNKTNKGDE